MLVRVLIWVRPVCVLTGADVLVLRCRVLSGLLQVWAVLVQRRREAAGQGAVWGVRGWAAF